MLATFSDQIREEWQENGVLGVLRVWFYALGELLSVAVPLQLRSSIVVAMSLAFLFSFGLFVVLLQATALTSN